MDIRNLLSKPAEKQPTINFPALKRGRAIIFALPVVYQRIMILAIFLNYFICNINWYYVIIISKVEKGYQIII